MHATEFPVESAADGLRRGDEAWRAGDLDLALYLYVQALGFDSKSPEPLLKIATVHELRGNRALAIRAFEMALERDPQNAGASERLGLLHLDGPDADLAKSFLERAIALDPGRWRSHNALGILADRAGDHAAALRSYDTALLLEPKAAPVMNNRGYSRLLSGDFAGAEIDLRAAIRIGARDEVWTNLGRALARQRRYPEALESLLHASDIAHAYNTLGEAAVENGDYLRARGYFEKASAAAPEHFEAAQKNLALVDEKLAASQARN